MPTLNQIALDKLKSLASSIILDHHPIYIEPLLFYIVDKTRCSYERAETAVKLMEEYDIVRRQGNLIYKL